MTVYLALREGSEWTDVLGVFTTKEKAQKLCDWHRLHPRAHWLNSMSQFVVQRKEVK